ncbi:hypothetical protein SAMN02745121_08216 [Nannocystis exedens]|uniref:Uncharacterized protein n=1 Tax=Nannocystis exedens TaxID=54 RepID=A0A1I2HUG6_9BACT|nr:hypothetical protein [Nannocystis exedens]PCC73193.1 hypothetical protein NAEX_06281 [Nannocystis exedens]SFF33412.1 hypothetical protein SAMN02745121_08216 [Nannocystis exedens]
MAKSISGDDIEVRHTLAIYRNIPRPLRAGRPTKEPPRQLVWSRRNIAPEALAAIEELMIADLGPNCVLERDGVVIHEGPKVEEKREKVEVGGYFPSNPAPPSELVECISKGTASPEVLATLTTASPSEAVRFSLDVLWETYQRTVQATEDLMGQSQRLLDRSMKQQEWFLNLLQKNSELELEIRALNAEEKVKEAERARARAEARDARPADDGPRISMQDIMAALRAFMDAARQAQTPPPRN